MALTRSFLRGLKLDEESVSAIIEAHAETVDGLKAVQNDLKAQLDTANEKITALSSNDWESKLNEVTQAFETFKSEQAAKDARGAKERAFTEVLKKAGVTKDKHISAIMKVTDLSGIEVDQNGKLMNEDAMLQLIRDDYSEFIPTQTVQGAEVAHPPVESTGTTVTKEQFAKMGYAQRLELYNSDPDTYNALKG